MSIAGSPTRSSPARKRQRLSSPTYDQHLGDLSQEDIAAFDIIEAQLSRSQSPEKSCIQPDAACLDVQQGSRCKTDYSNIQDEIDAIDDPDNPFTAPAAGTMDTLATFTLASSTSLFGFSKASTIPVDKTPSVKHIERSPSPEEPLARDFDSWFEPTTALPVPAFQNASATMGFTKASHKGLIMPSSSALAKAQAKMQEIWQEPDSVSTSALVKTPSAVQVAGVENVPLTNSSMILKSSPRRPALQSVGNSLEFNSPVTPLSLGSSRSSTAFKKVAPTMTPTQLFISKNSKPFKSPLLNKQAIAHVTPPCSTSNLGRRLGVSSVVGSQFIPTPSNRISASVPRQPITPDLGAAVRAKSPAPFVTPFKPGLELTQTQHSRLRKGEYQSKRAEPLHGASARAPTQVGTVDQSARMSFFDLDLPLDRQTLDSSGLVPKRLEANELEAMEIPIELAQMTPQLAMYYSFHNPTNEPSPPSSSIFLGPAQAFSTLVDYGCFLATKPWVDNHWSLILWKLAGMVCLNPQQEVKVDKKKWCWEEVMRQLLYRYERELNRGKRPPLRLITTQDASAAYPMVLCISDILWLESESQERSELYPELELTDGWYRLRARVDPPLARAIRRGIIKVGRKIMVAGAYLVSERKEPSEILDAYNSVKLAISGNSSHMAPWHAKLGFVPGPCISTLHSLTPDGGLVAVMDLVVTKAHPIAYIEFIDDENGNKSRRGPMNAKEEAIAHEQWKKRWEIEMSKLRLELEEKYHRYMGYIERLERRAGAEFKPDQDDAFEEDDIENIYDELEDPILAPKAIGAVAKSKCTRLAQYIRERMEKDKLRIAEDLENEMKHICPPRNVRNFRIIVVQDARTRRRPSNRKALLTVWDVLSLSFYEGAMPGSFEIGQRFMVTNLKPTNQKSWMGLEPNAEIYLCSGQSSRWTPIRTSIAS